MKKSSKSSKISIGDRANMNIEVTLKNYRCFQDTKPAQFCLQKGFTSFIGVNNSGKSSLLKFFYEFRPIFQTLSSFSANFQNALFSKCGSVGYGPTIKDHDEIFCNLNKRDLEAEFVFNNSVGRNNLPILNKVILRVFRDHSWNIKIHINNKELDVKANQRNFEGAILKLNNQAVVNVQPLFDNFNSLAETLYIGPFRNAINIGTKDDYYDIKVGQSFIKEWNIRKSGDKKIINEAMIDLTDDIKNIFGFDRLEIGSSPNEMDLKVFVDSKSYLLSEQGAGLAQFILVLANAAIRKPSFILIDEPELNLHPSLQLDFLVSLGSHAKEGLLFATHSIGLARSGSEFIYSLRKNRNNQRELRKIESTPRLLEFLGEISFSGYRELGLDKILLVEGRTDVKTIQQFLRKLRKDHKVVLLPLGGSGFINGDSVSEIEEIRRISKDVLALIDSEKNSKKDGLSKGRTAFKKICQKAKIKIHVLEKRSIENYLSEKAIKKIKGGKYSALDPYESLKEVELGWSKSENWKIAREMNKEDFIGTDLGKFLKSL